MVAPNEKRLDSVADTAKDLRVGLSSVLEESMNTVKKNASVIEQEYFTPTSTKLQDFAEKNPVVFTFLAVFGFLSVFPLLFALGFIALCMSMAIIGAVMFLLAVLGFVLFLTSFVLTPILIVTTSIAIFTTSCLVGLFLATRLYILTRDADFHLATGLQQWFEETKGRVAQMIPAQAVEVKQVVIHGTETDAGEEGEVDVKRVELQLVNGNVKTEMDRVALVVDDQDQKAEQKPDPKPNEHFKGLKGDDHAKSVYGHHASTAPS